MNAKYSIQAEITFGSAKNAHSASEALKPELGLAHETRAKTDIKLKNNSLALNIAALDKAALRASFNSFAKSIILITRFLEV